LEREYAMTVEGLEVLKCNIVQEQRRREASGE
jgi:hypothetical protein